MYKLFASLLVSILFCLSAPAQSTGTIAGKVMDQKTGAVLPGISITWNEGKGGKVSDVEGRYALQLPAGTYTLKFEGVGYQGKIISEIKAKAGDVVEVNVVLTPQSKELEGVVVTASARRESISSVLAMQKNNASISDGISIEAIKKSPDRNIGEVLKRVSGTSIQDDKFVLVRGLSDRYNVALINGALLPSTEPDRRAFSFDIVPSQLIDNILINKTASPDMPGDFSGGIVQIMTKDIPFRNFLSISAGVGYNDRATGKPLNIGILNPTDYLAFDNGLRAFPDKFPSTSTYLDYGNDPAPDRRLAASRLMRNNYGSRYTGNALPSLNAQISWGGKKELARGGTIGSVVALVYRNAQGIQNNQRREYESNDTRTELLYDYNDSNYTFNSNASVLANFAYKKGSNKFAFKNTLNRSFDNSTLVRSGFNKDNSQYFQTNGTVTVIKSLISSQLEGEHVVSGRNDRLKWNVNYALTAQNQPDYRVLPYSKSLSDAVNKAVPYSVVLRDTYRYWSDLYDNAFGGNLNYTLPLTFGGHQQQLKAGVFGQYKIRDFKTRIFRYERASSSNFNEDLMTKPARIIFNDGYIYNEGFVLDEITNPTDKYDGNSGLYAGYAMIDGRISEKLRAVYGVRVEHFGFVVNTAGTSGEKLRIDRSYLDVLPSLNLTYSLTNATNLRFSTSHTVSRPEFREVANFGYYDFVRNAELRGNPDLERSQNTNIDLRFESYPSAGEIVSASLFFKHFQKPIEQAVVPGSFVNSPRFYFANPESAQTYGAEVEVRKKLNFLGSRGWLENLVFNVNAALMASRVDLESAGLDVWDTERPLQGQSPWLINAGLQYALPNNKFSFSALVNRIGHRIAYVGTREIQDIYENGRTQLDFQAALRVFGGKGEVKLNFADLLNQRSIFYQNLTTQNQSLYKASEDRIQWSYLSGRNFSVGFTYNFE